MADTTYNAGDKLTFASPQGERMAVVALADSEPLSDDTARTMCKVTARTAQWRTGTEFVAVNARLSPRTR